MKIHSKNIVLLAVAALCASSAAAAPVTPEQALQRAVHSQGLRECGSDAGFKLAMTSEVEGTPAAYVFKRDAQPGFIVTPADDNMQPVWGYSTSDFVDENGEFAPGFIYWLDFMGKRAAEFDKYESPLKAVPRPQREPIAPLCSTQWGQQWPYYNMCPIMDGQRSVTGCAATSMAQVMKYHNWPPSGVGSNSYKWNETTLEMDFSSAVFDWNNMLDSYYGNPTRAQQNAVALLMKAAGYAINMNYSPYGSGAMTTPMGNALIENFSYGKEIRYMEREWYSLYEWENLVYASLQANCPVIYNGQSNDGGHSFVCDGYSSNGYFHINWGWNGLSDGYFLLDALDPDHQGTGGSGDNSGFRYYQRVFTMVRPDHDGSATPYYQVVVNGPLQLTGDAEKKVVYIKNMVYNPGAVTIPSGSFGLSFTPVSKNDLPIGETLYAGYTFGDSGEEDDGPLKVGYGWRDIDVDVSDIPYGRYLVKPFFAGEGEEPHDMVFQLGTTNAWIVMLKDRRYTMKAVSPVVPRLEDISFASEFSDEMPINASGTIINPIQSSTTTFIHAVVLSEDESEVLASSSTATYSLDSDALEDFEFSETVEDVSALQPDKNYKVALACADGVGGVWLMTEPADMLFTGSSSVRRLNAEIIAEKRDYYNAQGVRVAVADPGEPSPDLPKGVYFVRSTSGSLKIVK